MLGTSLEFTEEYLFIPLCANSVGNCIAEDLVKSCGTEEEVSSGHAASEEISLA